MLRHGETVKFAIAYANTGPFCDPARATEFARAAEVAGFESLWTVEHVVVPADYASPYPYSKDGKMPGRDDSPIPDPLIWLTYIAAATRKIKLATGILILPQRQPVVLAKELATLDALSGGRMMLGVGAGWLREEFDALGVPFDDRGARLDEHVAVLRTLWGQPEASFAGEFTQFERCVMRPQPVNGSIPIHVGGHSPAAARRAGRLGDGFFPGEGRHEPLREIFELARESARRADRDPNALEFTSGGHGAVGDRALEEVEQLAELGVSRVVLPSFLFYKDTDETLARYGEDVIARS